MRRVMYVSPSTGNWKIHWEGEQEGIIFRNKEEAIIEARRMTGALPEGQVSSIRVQRADGVFQTEWTYGKDPYPPKG